ncbi:hypothetical protein FGIG_07246 [Fasciola gigantica]|uniref:Uncharacterized protein n=1 Tax=Fasciola gigantica TaxID=46835 RepID=A0A504Z2W6_FASGI|nr:hypothetical protein FGIG_07246 [Fasciola gigantica]
MSIVSPLTDLLNSTTKPVHYYSESEAAFAKARETLADITMPNHLNSDPNTKPTPTTNASDTAMGEILHQQVDNQFQPAELQSTDPTLFKLQSFSLRTQLTRFPL